MSHEKAKKIIMEHFIFNKETARLHCIKQYKYYGVGHKFDHRFSLFIAGKYYNENEIMWLYHRDTIQHSICTIPWYNGDDRTRLIDMPKALNKLLFEHASWLEAVKYGHYFESTHVKVNKKSCKVVFSYNGTQEYLGTFKYGIDAFEILNKKRLEILKQELPKYTHNIFCNVEEAGRKGPFYLPPANEVIL
jgi:hypothetical protein